MATQVSQKKGNGRRPFTAYTITWAGPAVYAGSIRLEVRLGTQLTNRKDWAHVFFKPGDTASAFADQLFAEWQARHPNLNIRSMSHTSGANTVDLGLDIEDGEELYVVWVEDGNGKVTVDKIVPNDENDAFDMLGLSVYSNTP